jgi:hypothetical protein
MLALNRLLAPVFILVLFVFATWISLSISKAAKLANETAAAGADKTMAALPTNETTAAGLAAWDQVYLVLISPRCINCHTATNYPQQGDDRHRHFANVIRGPGNIGVPGLSCDSCHQESNADSTGVPGGRGWHLAPLSMQWQDLNDRPLSSGAVCRAVTDRSKNENMEGQDLLKHHEKADLVLWAWNPGRRPDGTLRTTPPISHQEFVAATRTWIEAGTPCPKGR